MIQTIAEVKIFLENKTKATATLAISALLAVSILPEVSLLKFILTGSKSGFVLGFHTDAVIKVVTSDKHSRKILITLFDTGHKILQSPHMQTEILKKITELREAYEGDSARRALVLSSMDLTDKKIFRRPGAGRLMSCFFCPRTALTNFSNQM